MSLHIKQRLALEMFWPTFDPFLFCAFHDDRFPKANGKLGPDASLAGRHIGQDFQGKDGWRMYHGSNVPGFPAHPHRGFETVTIVNEGFVDHADSIGAAGRYGEGDTQWMTAGKGVQHSEMFPLLDTEQPNPMELFQIWLNLPAKNKMVEPHFAMLWNEKTPLAKVTDDAGKLATIKVVAGEYNAPNGETYEPVAPPPNSWAADANNDVAIWIIDLDEEAHWTLPAASKGLTRTLYFFEGESAIVDGTDVSIKEALVLDSDADISMENTGKKCRFLLLQGRPIGEPVQQHGPFVMNTRQELQQAFHDYQRTQFGGWPWERNDQTHGDEKRRFARHSANGAIETP
ncbi:pirin family protein [Marinomonas piezotolerans]|uniref:Pirin family protein n=1 Tax=Marinomonas piezotolerans TaxID=2213058 RepID=A0A370U7T3_9GAMM|nr:pirin-like C-terminal cupin domain-containing protein [Marinomonas piezotolerans]RDL43815.1 pirin family protein [Marinomonas piezotolerans]